MTPTIDYDYHIHANVLNKPDLADAFIKRAIELGLREICITDHAPYPHIHAADRIPVGMTREYCSRVRELADKYSHKIIVKCGMEIDYHPSLEAQIEDFLREGDFDYVLGSTHMHLPDMLDVPMSELTPTEYAAKCFENNLEAVKSGYFDAIAHIDMYRWSVTIPGRLKEGTTNIDVSQFEDIAREIFSEMKRRETALEINTHLMVGNSVEKVYPSAQLMGYAADYGLAYRFGSDAHTPDAVGHGRGELVTSEIYKGCWR